MMYIRFGFLLVFGILAQDCLGQVNFFRNSSFEENGALNVQKRNQPSQWQQILDSYQSSPDQQPGVYGVSKPAFKGSYYAGIVSRPPGGPSGGWELIGQQLAKPFEKNKSYTILMHLCYDPGFKVPWDGNVYYFQDPIPLSLYIYSRTILNPSYPPTYNWFPKFVGKTEKPIDHAEWKYYAITFTVEEEGYDFFVFSAEPPGQVPTGANIMIDEVFLAESSKIDSVANAWAKEDSIRSIQREDTIRPREDTISPGPREDSLRYCIVSLPNLLIHSNVNENRFFKPTCYSAILSYTLTVFDRWGKRVYEGNQTNQWWSGNDNSGMPLSDGSYFYDFRYSNRFSGEDVRYRLNGWVSLLNSK